MTRTCQHPDCNKYPCYGFDGNKPLYCGIHRLVGMVDVKHKKCEYVDCNKELSYGFNGNKARYCATHRLEGMIDVTKKTCKYNECNIRPNFAYHGNKPLYCATHRLNGMINVYSKTCKTVGCDIEVTKQTYQGYCLHCFMHLFPNEKIARNYKVKENEVLNFVAEKFSSCTIVRDKRIEDGCSARRPDLQIDLGFQVIIVESMRTSINRTTVRVRTNA